MKNIFVFLYHLSLYGLFQVEEKKFREGGIVRERDMESL